MWPHEPEKDRNEPDHQVDSAAQHGAHARYLSRPGTQKAGNQFDSDNCAADGDRQLLCHVEPAGIGPEKLELVRRDLRQARRDPADLSRDHRAQNYEPHHYGDALDHIGDCIGQKTTDDGIGPHQHRRQRDRAGEAQAGVGAHDLAECAHLRGCPDDGPRQQHDHHQLFDALRIALAKQVGEGREAPAPQGTRKKYTHHDNRGRVTNWVDESAGEPLLEHCPARGHDRLRAEVCRKDGKRDEPRAKAPARQNIVGLTRHAARHPRADGKLHEHIGHDRQQQPVHGLPQPIRRATPAPVNCMQARCDATRP